MKVWITKYALTRGIYEIEAKVCKSVNSQMIQEVGGQYSMYYHNDEWHETKKEAVAYAESMRDKKIASLKKKIKNLKELKFS